MKQFMREVGLAVILGMLMPALILHIVTFSSHRHISSPISSVTEPVVEGYDIPVLADNGIVHLMELEEYITGVVLAEMPASFEIEALKAQSVVARTYTLRADSIRGKHVDAAVCMDSACCQAYRSTDDYLAMGGSADAIEKVKGAVDSTRDLVLTYNGELIEATYFSCSGGSTEDAVEVWGTEVPYLKSVSSPGEENATHFSDMMSFTREQMESAFDISLGGDPSEWFRNISYTSGGGVDSIQIGSAVFSGTEVRKRLDLYSTAFTVSVDDDTVTFHTSGFGHRVGMSQYGADVMAASGSDFREILAHYYRGAVIQRRSD